AGTIVLEAAVGEGEPGLHALHYAAMSRRTKWLLLALLLIAAGGGAGWGPWASSPRSGAEVDQGEKGIWGGRPGFTGERGGGGGLIGPGERQAFVKGLQRHHIKWVFVHAGPINEGGTISDAPTAFSAQLRKDTPDLEWIPWLGGDTRKLRLADPDWRKSV